MGLSLQLGAGRWHAGVRVGGRGPEATRTNTGPSRWKLSPLPARPRPPCSCRRIRDGTERRRGQTARRTSSLRPGPLPAQTPPAAAAPGVPRAATAHAAPPPRVLAESDLRCLLGPRIGGEQGAGRPRRIPQTLPMEPLGRRLGLDRNWGKTGGTVHTWAVNTAGGVAVL